MIDIAAPRTGPTAKKRPEDRLGHRTKAEKGTMEIIEADLGFGRRTVEVPESLVPDENWHPVAREAWDSYVDRPDVRQYAERTDYVQAWMTAGYVNLVLQGAYTAGTMMQVRLYLADLGFTEGSRRALNLAIKRAPVEADPKKVIAFDRLKSRKQG